MMDIRIFLNKNIGRRLQIFLKNNNIKNKDAIKNLDFYNSDKNEKLMTNTTLSKILNGNQNSLSEQNMNDIANKIMDTSFEEVLFGDDSDKLYFIRIILYNLLGNEIFFNIQEIEKAQSHPKVKFKNLPNASLEYWIISVAETPQTKTVSGLLFYALLQDAKFSRNYFNKIYKDHNPLKEYSTIILNQLKGNSSSKLIDSILPKSLNLLEDLDLFISFLQSFNLFITENQDRLLEYFNTTIYPKILEIIYDNDKFMLKLKNDFFIEQFSSDNFIDFLKSTISVEGEATIKFMSLFLQEKRIREYRSSLYDSDFDYSTLDDIDLE